MREIGVLLLIMLVMLLSVGSCVLEYHFCMEAGGSGGECAYFTACSD